MIKPYTFFLESLELQRESEEKSPTANIHKGIGILLKKLSSPYTIGDSIVIDNHFIETHTLGCRVEAGTGPEDIWNEHYEIYDEYTNDGMSVVIGDPSEGIFITVTPI